MENKLIIDAGFHKGEDADFYLKSGYTVVAIDASVKLVAEGKKKFKKYIDSGQLILLNYAINKYSNQEIEFHFSEDSVWNSCNKNISNRQNKFVKSELVQTIDRKKKA